MSDEISPDVDRLLEAPFVAAYQVLVFELAFVLESRGNLWERKYAILDDEFLIETSDIEYIFPLGNVLYSLLSSSILLFN